MKTMNQINSHSTKVGTVGGKKQCHHSYIKQLSFLEKQSRTE
jgi:hypothetical protein